MKDLVKNPIGIVALFISLIYSIANLVLGATASSLTHDERFPIIIFIVVFPVIVLAVFYMLVSRHHGKLYAPGDYKNDQSFLRTLSQEEKEQKLESEAQETFSTPVENNPVSQTNSESQPRSGQRMAEIRRDLELVESLVVKQLEAELGQRAERDVGVGQPGVNFDALFHTNGKLTFLEIKSIRSASLSPFTDRALARILYSAMLADRFLNSNFKLILVVVYHFDEAALPPIEEVYRKQVKQCPVNLELRFISRTELDAQPAKPSEARLSN